jgi:hypothetical protein
MQMAHFLILFHRIVVCVSCLFCTQQNAPYHTLETYSMFRLRYLTLSLTLAVSMLLYAQQQPYKLSFISAGWPETPKTTVHSFWKTMATPDHVVDMKLPSTGKGKGTLYTFVKEIATGKVIGQHERPFPGGENAFGEDLVLIGGKPYLIYGTLDRKTGKVVVFAEGISLPDGHPEGPGKEIGTISFDPKSLDWRGKLGVTLYSSDDGDYTAFYFDRIQTKEDEQLVLVFMLNKELDPVWQQGYQIAFDSQKINTLDVAVSDDGVVYALMGARFKNKAISAKEVNYETRLFGMAKDGMASQAIALEGSHDVLTCDLVLRKGTLPTVGGFYVERGGSTEETAGYFMCAIDPSMEATPSPRNYPFRSAVNERMVLPRLFAKSDGSVHLTGLGQLLKGMSMAESFLFAALFDESLTEVWNTVIPKTLTTSMTDQDYGSRAFFGNDELLLLVPELEENIALHQKKDELKKMRKGADAHMVVGFSDTGEPFFSKFGAPDVYKIMLREISYTLQVQRGLYEIPCKKVEGKVETPGMLILQFE